MAARARTRPPGRRPALHVFYDGSCGLCVPTVAALGRLDIFNRVRFVDVVGQRELVERQFPALRGASLMEEMHGVRADGLVTAGFDTYRELARVLPLGWPAWPLMHLPPVAAIGRRVWRVIAAHRHRGVCALPSRPPRGLAGAMKAPGRNHAV